MKEPADTVRLNNAMLVLENELVPGSLLIRDGLIEAIEEEAAATKTDALTPAGERHVDCGRDYLLPGQIELHTDNLERHSMPRPAAPWPDLFAAAIAHDREIIASGITTVFDSIRVGTYRDESDARSEQLFSMLAALARGDRHGAFKADHRLHLRCELTDPDLLAMLDRVCDEQVVSLISLMDHTPGQRQWADMDALRKHSEGSYASRDAMERAFQRRIELGDRHVPPNRAAVIERFRGSKVALATHDDTTKAHVDEAKSLGVGIAEFPCSMEAAVAADAQGLKTLGGAPNIVRGGSHSGNVSMQELAEADVLHGLSSDYVPASLLQAIFKLVGNHGWALPRAVALTTANTADMAGLSDRGRLAVGLRADLVRVRLAEGTPVVESVYVGGRRVG